MITQGQNNNNKLQVWAILSYRAGENTQILALAETLEQRLRWHLQRKKLVYRPTGFLINLSRGVGLAGIDVPRSDRLRAPWPDVVVSAGLRNEPVCRWIRTQSHGRTKLVFLGRTWAAADEFDLTITTPQYRVPDHPRVLHNRLTLHRVTHERLEREADFWRPRLAHLPRPRIAVLLGGSSGPYVLGERAAKRLGVAVDTLARALGGSLMVTGSSRTPPGALATMGACLSAPHELYRWRADDADNPYFGFLALADRLVVTADSIAMLSEAVAAGKPVCIFDPQQKGAASDVSLASSLYRLMMRFGPRRLTRDVTLVHRNLIDAGLAAGLSECECSTSRAPANLPDMDAAVERVRALVRR